MAADNYQQALVVVSTAADSNKRALAGEQAAVAIENQVELEEQLVGVSGTTTCLHCTVGTCVTGTSACAVFDGRQVSNDCQAAAGTVTGRAAPNRNGPTVVGSAEDSP